eukprot:18796-Heterococcus_DN1.PRE.3
MLQRKASRDLHEHDTQKRSHKRTLSKARISQAVGRTCSSSSILEPKLSLAVAPVSCINALLTWHTSKSGESQL